MKPFCDIDQYCNRYGRDENIDYLLLHECLLDASYKVVAELEYHGIDWRHRLKQDREYKEKLKRVVRDMAHRAVVAENIPDIPLGATQFQESANGFQTMASFNGAGSSGFGELYITKSERKLLNIGIPKIFTIEPFGLRDFAKKARQFND